MLDAGCGNARLALALERAARCVEYVGVDASRELIGIARARGARLKNVRADFFIADLAEPAWARELPREFEIVAALAVLHHLPSFDLRARVVVEFARLLAPGGRVLMTNWQFLNDARMRKKIVAWSAAGVDAHAVDEGDALLAWKRGGSGYRYCHHLTPAEVEAIARRAGLRVEQQFSGDAGLNLYSILLRE